MSNSVNTALGFPGRNYQVNMRQKRSLSLAMARLLAFLTSLVVLAQVVYTLVNQEAFCLNQGCKIVESFTRVPPLVFNLVGFFFFLLIFWGLSRMRKRPYRVPPLISVLLLAALAAEGVLLAFQLQIAQTLCWYCLYIFACVALLNLLLGIRQTMQGLVLFLAVFLSFSSLNYGSGTRVEQALTFTDGAFAVRKGSDQSEEHYLFLSATCVHCKVVLDGLETMLEPTVFFNSVDQVKELSLLGLEQRPNWSAQVNKELLRLLGINSVPVLISKSNSGLIITHGEQAILLHLRQQKGGTQAQEGSGQSQSISPSIFNSKQEEDSCRVDADCTELSSPSALPQR